VRETAYQSWVGIVSLIAGFLSLGILCSGVAYTDDPSFVTWTVGPLEEEGTTGINAQISADTQDILHITYRKDRSGYDSQLKHAIKQNNTWIYEIFDTGIIGDSAMTTDALNRPCVAYSKGTNLIYAVCTDDVWSYTTVDNNVELYSGVSLALDLYNHPHLAYSKGSSLKYAYYNGFSWVKEVVATDQGQNIGITSLALDYDGNAYIAYTQHNPEAMKYAAYSNGIWDISQPDSEADALSVSLTMDIDKVPHLAYSANGLKYAYQSGKSWIKETVDATQSPRGISMLVNRWGKPCIAYGLNLIGLKYAYRINAAWQTSFIDEVYLTGGFISMTTDRMGNPRVAYYLDNTTERDLYYAWTNDYTDVSLSSFNAVSETNKIHLLWQVQTADEGLITGYNLYRRLKPVSSMRTKLDKNTDWIKINNSLVTGSGLLSYDDLEIALGSVYQYKLEAVTSDGANQTLAITEAVSGKQGTSFSLDSVYPSPVRATLHYRISSTTTGSCRVSLFDLAGRMVLQDYLQIDSAGEHNSEMDVSALSPGIYTLQAQKDTVQSIKKVVIGR
jgi:hypothetical protein